MNTITDWNPDAWAALEAENHQPERFPTPGCACGSNVWSTEHVAIMVARAALTHLRNATPTVETGGGVPPTVAGPADSGPSTTRSQWITDLHAADDVSHTDGDMVDYLINQGYLSPNEAERRDTAQREGIAQAIEARATEERDEDYMTGMTPAATIARTYKAAQQSG